MGARITFGSGCRSWMSAAMGLLLLLIAGCGGGGGGDSTPAVSAPSGLSYTSPVTLTQGVAATTLTPTVTGTVTSYSVSPALPAGLSLDPTTGDISGTPTTASAASTYVVTAKNAGGSTTFSLSLTVVMGAPSGLSYATPNTYVQGIPITPLTPTVTGTVTTYSVSPALPAGLTLDPSSGQLSGTPTTPTASANYYVTATNSGGSTNFALTITVVIPPPSQLSYATPQTYIQGTAITPLVPAVTGQVTSYTVTPALPAGLTIDTVSGTISGTPTTPTASAFYTVVATNSSGSAFFSLNITVVIPAPSQLAYPSPQTYTQGTAITPLNPTVTGTVTSYYAVLPAGLSINTSTGQITGTPTTPSAAASYVVTAYNSTGSTTFNITITVRLAAPSALSYRSPQTYNVGATITPLLPSVHGTVANYTVTPALPAGLTLDAVTGRITGTPTTATARASYAVTATNSTGSATFNLSIAVVLQPPSSLSYTNPQVYAIGMPIAPLSPFVVGIVSSYSVVPALPAGLSLDAATGQISGTPTTLTATSTYTVTATNASGSSSFGLTVTVANVGLSPARISRIAASGTPVVVALQIQSLTLSGNLFVTASDTSGVFSHTVGVSASSTSGSYALALTLSTTIAAGHYTGNVTLTLCSDAGCTTPQNPASVSEPFDIQILSASSTWPGNNLTSLAPYPGVPDWNMYQGNAGHTGYVPVSLDPNSFTTRWQGPTLNNTAAYSSVPQTLTTDGGQIYLAYGNKLYALKESDASQVWLYDFSSLAFPSVNPPAEANQTVYIAAGQQSSTYMFAFNEADGTLVFKSPMSSQWENYLAPTIGPQGVYTNAGTYGGLYGFNFSGDQLFFENLSQVSMWTPAVDANYVYSYTGPLTLADPVTGAAHASINDPTYTNYVYQINGSAVLGAPGSVFAADYENSYINGGGIGNWLLDFNTTNNTVSWKIQGDYPSTPAYHAGVVYAANNNPMRLEARSETDGTLLWSWTPPQAGDTTFNSEVLLTNTLAFVSTNLATYGIDTASHHTVWSYPLSGRLALSQNGTLFIQGVGPVVAINVK